MLVGFGVFLEQRRQRGGVNRKNDAALRQTVQQPLLEIFRQLRAVMNFMERTADIKENRTDHKSPPFCEEERLQTVEKRTPQGRRLFINECKRLRPFTGFILNKGGSFVNMPNDKEWEGFSFFCPKE